MTTPTEQVFDGRLRRLASVAIGFLVIAFFSSAALRVQAQEDAPAPEKSVDAVELFNKGQDAHEKGDLTAAVALYEKAIAAMPEFPEAEYQRGSALLSLGRRDDAEKAFRRAAELRPDWTLALGNLGSILVGKRQFTEAEKILTKAVELDDQNTLALSALTELRLSTRTRPEDLKELLAKLTTLTGKAKPTAGAWAARGAIESALGEKIAARTSFERALELDPKNQFALLSKAGSLLNDGDAKGAESIVRTLESLAPNSADVKVLRARLLVANGKADEASVLLAAMPDPSPAVIELRDKILLTQVQNGPELEKRLEKSPRDAALLSRLCTVYRVEAPARALEYCRRASEAEPDNVNHAVGFGAALVQAKMLPEAVDLLRKLEAVSPENVTIRTNLATALFQMKRYPEAKTEFQWISEKQPTSPAAYYFLGIVHDQLTEYLDAMANYQLFLRYADAEKNKAEIEKVNLRLPTLQKQIKDKKGKQRS